MPSLEKTMAITLTPEQGLKVSNYLLSKQSGDEHLMFLARLYGSLEKETILYPNEVDYELIRKAFK